MMADGKNITPGVLNEEIRYVISIYTLCRIHNRTDRLTDKFPNSIQSISYRILVTNQATGRQIAETFLKCVITSFLNVSFHCLSGAESTVENA